MEYAELELTLHRRDSASYALELRFNHPESDSDIRLLRDGAAPVRFDATLLLAAALDSEAYGRSLAESLFADPAARSAFAQARVSAQSVGAPLRMRLLIGADATELHSLRWEMLRDPEGGAPLLMGEQLLFSRYLSSHDWRPVKMRPKGDLRALVAIANPSGLERYHLAPVDVDGELERATSGLGAIPVTALRSGGSTTLNTILARLREGYDILYLVAHGALVSGESWVWLEDDGGGIARASGTELARRLQELTQRPRLVVLASCQSAGSGEQPHDADTSGALAALGPRLAEAGVPAVLAMQGNISMATVAQFMPVFFQELQRDGQIDRAIAVARGAVRDRDDFWMPALFMRLKSGRIWYVPGFGDQKDFRKWPTLINSVRNGRCTPILGPGLVEPLFGSTREIAQRWAETYDFPMDPHEREDLPQVAQYVAVNQDEQFIRDELAQSLHDELLRQHRERVPDLPDGAPLDELIKAVGAVWRARDQAEPHRVLAAQPFPIYITTNPDSLLEAALEEAGKSPRVALCPWNEYVESSQEVYDEVPSAQRPLVYHLFGRLQEPDSLVLTEDDYFNYLIGVTSNKDLIPDSVRRALADTALLFLGFRMDDWNFRVLFRSFMSQEGRGRSRKYTHVAAQIDPEQGRIQEPERARRYLESYFQGAAISIYWGNAEDFVRELAEKLAATK
ncbi:MAG TPA: CHAT domain-containing protein [Roseiflexaceae bacterium]|nr:CHAT domain-containing protein [Roseiflexaceae bacterium]